MVRLQSTGSNNNLWGGYLNDNQEILERGSKGYQAYTVTGDATISQTNYSKTNDYAVGTIKLNGSPTASWTHTLPARQQLFNAWNNSGQSGTLKTSGGTGVTIPHDRRTLVYGDATDYYSAAPTWLAVYATTLTYPGDVVVKATFDSGVAAAIAAASISNTGQVLISAADTTSGYAADKTTVDYASLTTTQISGLTSLELEIENPGANEKLKLTMGHGYVGGFLNGGLKSAAFTPSQGNGYDVDCSSGGFTCDLGSMTDVQLGQEIKINKFGTSAIFFKGTVNGATDLTLDTTFNQVLRYCGSSWGWNVMTTSDSGANFTDPKQLSRSEIAPATLEWINGSAFAITTDLTAAFTGLTSSGLADTTDWATDTYKSLLSVSEPGELLAYIGPTSGAACTHTVEFTVDGVVTEIPIAVSTGTRRPVLHSGGPMVKTAMMTANAMPAAYYGPLSTSKREFSNPTAAVAIPLWHQAMSLSMPRLTWKSSLLVRAKNSLAITNSTATAYSAILYRLKGNT